MGLVKAYYQWQRSIEDLEDSINHFENRVKHIKDPEERGYIKGGLTFLNKSFKELKESCEELGNLIDKHF